MDWSLYTDCRAGPNNKLLEIILKKPLQMSILDLHFKIIESPVYTHVPLIQLLGDH